MTALSLRISSARGIDSAMMRRTVEKGAKMASRIGLWWEDKFRRPGSLGVAFSVWAIMLGGVYASTLVSSTRGSVERSFVEHEPELSETIRLRSPAVAQEAPKAVDASPELASAETGANIATSPKAADDAKLQTSSIPVPSPRPVRAEMARPATLRTTADLAAVNVPVPALERYASCDANCRNTASPTNAMDTAETAGVALPFDDGPVVEGRVPFGAPLLDDLKHLADATLHPLRLFQNEAPQPPQAMVADAGQSYQ
jgi:hypothetical protein